LPVPSYSVTLITSLCDDGANLNLKRVEVDWNLHNTRRKIQIFHPDSWYVHDCAQLSNCYVLSIVLQTAGDWFLKRYLVSILHASFVPQILSVKKKKEKKRTSRVIIFFLHKSQNEVVSTVLNFTLCYCAILTRQKLLYLYKEFTLVKGTAHRSSSSILI
jgi:hypothetical protein